METNKITITRALGELKLLDSRITKTIGQSSFVDIYQNRKDLVLRAALTKEVFEKKAKSSMDSIIDLIERRKKIKSAILISNANVKVLIGGVSYAVIEAIDRKNSIKYEQALLTRMRNEMTVAKSEIEKQKPQLESTVEEMIKNNLGDERKPSKDDYDNISKPFLDANELNLLDPCKVSERIEKLDEEIDTFIAEVDLCLTESNSTTFIEV